VNPLDSVIDWYRVIKDSQAVLLHLTKLHPNAVPSDSLFAGRTLEDAKALLQKASDEVDDLTIVSLVSVFEQTILDYLTDVTKTLQLNQPGPFPLQVLSYGLERSERWYFPDVLDFFKVIVATEIVGQVKQIYQYRNFVAHGKKGAKPVSSDPLTAYKKLSIFLKEANLL
jgi:hypothetical protein